MSEPTKPRRPSLQQPISLEALAERSDPIGQLHAAHETAAVLLRTGQAADDPGTVDRLVAIVDEVGLPTLAELWAPRPATSMPGALYRLYLLHEWVTTEADAVAAEFAAGLATGSVTAPTTPEQVKQDADEILRGAFTGDFADALDRAASFCLVVAAGRTDADRAVRLTALASEFSTCAGLWRSNDLQ